MAKSTLEKLSDDYKAVKERVETNLSPELEKVDLQFKAFDEQVKDLATESISNRITPTETEQQTKLSTKEVNKADGLYIKPTKSIGSREKFNENFRKDYEAAKEYVKVIAENLEIIGSAIEMWTKPFPGCQAEFWTIPVNKPIYVPRHVAEQISKCYYTRYVMDEGVGTGGDGYGKYYGAMAVAETKRRLDCRSVGFNFQPIGAR